MKQSLWWALAVVLGASLYLGTSSDEDDLLAPQKGDAARRPTSAGSGAGPDRAEQAKPGKPQAIEPQVAQALQHAVQRWQQRSGSQTLMPATQGAHAWRAARPPAPPAPVMAQNMPDPKPVAPAFPHAWVGRFSDPEVAGSPGRARAPDRAVLVGAQSTWVVRAGDVIEGHWRIDQIQDRRMSLTYLPLNQQQFLAMK